MKPHLFRSLSTTSLVAVFAVVAAAQARPAPAAALSGTIQTLSPAAQTLTVKSDAGTARTLNVTRATVIRRNAAAAQLFSLAPGDRILVGFNAATEKASRLIATGPDLRTTRGQVMEVDLTHKRLKIATSAGMHTFAVAAATRIVRNNRIAPFSAITLRDAVTVHSLPGNAADGPASDVEADGPGEEGQGGTIASISGSDLTFTPDDGGPAVTVHTDGTTIITLDGEPATLAQLAVGMGVQVGFDPVTKTAFSIQAESAGVDQTYPAVEGQIAAVDTTKGTVSIAPTGGGAVITLTVDANTQITANGQDGTFADVTVGSPIRAEYTTALLALQLEVGSSGGGPEDGGGGGGEHP